MRGKRAMMSRERKKKAAGLHEKLQILRSITHSDAVSSSSIIMAASEYIKELKQKVAMLKQETGCAEDARQLHTSYPKVTVQTASRGFLINVFSGNSCPGLLVSILEAFDELGLSVLEATASCSNNFRLEAVGGENQLENVDENAVEQAVLQAMRNSSEGEKKE